MIKRTIEIAREPAHLAVKLDQLLIQRHEANLQTAASIPCEDIGLLLVDEPRTSYSHHALVKLLEFGAAVVICGRDHLPAGLLLPISGHTEVVHRLHDQMAVSKPLAKRLWQQIVVAKIRGQAANLPAGSSIQRKLLTLAGEVRSGDPSNVEAHASKLYWSAWLGEENPFKRDPDGDGLNGMLNYGYAVMRAAVARALVAAGLHPALGIHHANRSNPFCLADDLMEPLRPLVDARVRELRTWNLQEIGPKSKPHLLSLLTVAARVGDQTGPLMVGLHRTVASLLRCYRGEEKRRLLPLAVENETC